MLSRSFLFFFFPFYLLTFRQDILILKNLYYCRWMFGYRFHLFYNVEAQNRILRLFFQTSTEAVIQETNPVNTSMFIRLIHFFIYYFKPNSVAIVMITHIVFIDFYRQHDVVKERLCFHPSVPTVMCLQTQEENNRFAVGYYCAVNQNSLVCKSQGSRTFRVLRWKFLQWFGIWNKSNFSEQMEQKLLTLNG